MPDTKPGANAWNGWEVMVLHDLGAPTSNTNIQFLALWQQFERSAAKNNPLNLTAPAGYTQINSAGVQSYGTQVEAAQFTANNIKNYPTLYKMLKSDSVNSVLHSRPSLSRLQLSPNAHLVSDLRKWGSGTFADFLAGGLSPGDKTTLAVQAPFHDISSAWNWVGNNWGRILYVIGGIIIGIIALNFLAKSQSNNTFTFSKGE